MAWLVLLGVISLPVIEIALFVKSAQVIGVVPTVAVAVAAGMGGIVLLRRQGVGVLWRAQAQLARGELPVAEAFDGLCLAMAGLMLVLPGFVTDVIGVLLLLPPVRAGLRWMLGRRFRAAMPGRGKADGGRVIEVEYHLVRDRDDDGRGGGGGRN
ncbi:MAG: FxsA family protein [Magnetospirillum sp.]|nr:FxsA family protein [Magnetospirillum sp.]